VEFSEGGSKWTDLTLIGVDTGSGIEARKQQFQCGAIGVSFEASFLRRVFFKRGKK
jgi:hypothetical protein